MENNEKEIQRKIQEHPLSGLSEELGKRVRKANQAEDYDAANPLLKIRSIIDVTIHDDVGLEHQFRGNKQLQEIKPGMKEITTLWGQLEDARNSQNSTEENRLWGDILQKGTALAETCDFA